MKILALVNDKTEESELIGTVSLLRRAKIIVDLISVSSKIDITGSHGTRIIADKMFNKDLTDYDALFIPGGVGVMDLKDKKDVLSLINQYNNDQKLIMAICAAPSILGVLDILKGKKYTCYPGFEKYIMAGLHQNKGVVVADNIITGKSVYFVTPFALEAIERLLGLDARKNVEKQICMEEKHE